MISFRIAGEVPAALRKRPGRVVLGLCSAQLFWATATYSQRWMTSFGPYQESRMDRPAAALAICRPSRDAGIQLIAGSSEPARLTVFSNSDSTGYAVVRTIEISAPPASLSCVDVDGDGVQECVSLAASGRTVSVIHLFESGNREENYHLDVRPQRFTVGDINGDRRPDLLLFGQTMTGITTLLGAPGGRFTPGPLLIPEISTSDLCIADLNGDRLPDLLLLDWLSEKLVVEYGLGKGVFAEQTRVPLPSEPGRLSAMSVTALRTFRIVITLPRAHAVAHLVRNAYGEISIKEIIDVHGRPRDAQLALLDGDMLPDLVCPTSAGVYVGLGTTAMEFNRGTIFGTGADASSWVLVPQALNRLPDLVLGERNVPRLMILKNGNSPSLPAGPVEYAVGAAPGAVAVADFNHDALLDVIVANAHSSTLSVLLNQGGGRLDGQVAWDIGEQPGDVYALPAIRSTPSVVLTTHPGKRQIGVAVLSSRAEITRTFALPTGPRPAILHAEADAQGGRLSILLTYGDQKRGEPYLDILEQLTGSRFVEHSFRANLPTRIAAVGTGTFSSDGSRCLAFVTHQRSGPGSAIYVAPAASPKEEGTVRPVLTLVDSISAIQAVVMADFDHDGKGDLALFRSAPDDAVGIAYGIGDGKFVPVQRWTSRVNPDPEVGTVIRDLNNDGLLDIAWVDRSADSVFVSMSGGDRSMTPPRHIWPSVGVSGMAIDHVTGGSTPDLILCRSTRHTISLISSPFAP
jgi:hypothetical protein